MKFVDVISGWINRYFSNEQAIYLVVFIAVVLAVLLTLGDVLAPLLTAAVFAFLLHGVVDRLAAWRVPRLLAIALVELVFLGAVIALLVGVLPLAWRQLGELVKLVPPLLGQLRESATELSTRYPDFVSETAVNDALRALSERFTEGGGALAQSIVGQLPNVLGLLIFLVLVPIALFFFLKDRAVMVDAFASLLPRERGMLEDIGKMMGVQIGNYVRGKFIEILIVGVVSYVTFTLFGLNYAALLGILVGVSVLIPFVGAAVVTLPVAAVAFLQFGWTLEFLLVVVAYAVIQALDGNALVPLLFSKAVNLHPISIIAAVLVFGGIWGFWGVFFAIPLATLVKAIYIAWPKQDASALALPR